MTLIIGTKNKAKVEQVRGILEPLGFSVQGLPDNYLGEAPEDGQTVLENARLKAVFYATALKQSILSMDNALYLDGLSPEEQPGLNVRRIPGRVDRPTDEEPIDYYSQLIAKLGGEVSGYWEYGICLAFPDGRTEEMSIKSPRKFVSQRSSKVIEGYPLESIQIDPETGKYTAEISPAEKDAFWRKVIGQELIEFVGRYLNKI
ncbi:MAG TPA: non-canonical purine NTP pyrophosphatase [bacterium]|nr:non-canonical purine NTP pyrophosphatase [bacterium]HPT29812.1 non-canonical purine NTP pyrophosphatase [bacterium]